MGRGTSLSLAIPAWNEAESVIGNLDVLERACGDLQRDGLVDQVEIVVCDDGSTDASPALLEAWAAASGGRHVVTHERNRGLGAAIRSALAATTGDLVLYTDADLPFDPRHLTTLLQALAASDADAVLGVRRTRDDEGPRRLAYSVAWNGLLRVVFGTQLRDVNFACKLLSREALDRLALHSDGSFIDAEIAVQLERSGARVEQVVLPYQARSTGVSTLSSSSVIRAMVVDLLRQQHRLRSVGPRPHSRSGTR